MGDLTVLGLNRSAERAALLCPFCRDDLEELGLSCDGCLTRYHVACVEELAGCGTLGCQGSIKAAAISARPRPSAVPATVATPFRDLALLLVGLGIPAAVLALFLADPDQANRVFGNLLALGFVLFLCLKPLLLILNLVRHPGDRFGR
jgi:hypothetical protein